MAVKQSWRLPDLSSVALQEGPSGSFHRPKSVFVPILLCYCVRIMLCFRKPFSYSVVSSFFRGWLWWRGWLWCPPEVTSDPYGPLPCRNLCSGGAWGLEASTLLSPCLQTPAQVQPQGVNVLEIPDGCALREVPQPWYFGWSQACNSWDVQRHYWSQEEFYLKQGNSPFVSLPAEGNTLCPLQHWSAEGLKSRCWSLSINLVTAGNQEQFQQACFDILAGCLSYKSGLSDISLIC